MPKISVIVPVYNAEKYLHRCIDSILAQTFTDFELLLIDDGSKDRSGAICDEYAEQDPRVRVFHKENGGVSSARNVGLDNAKGEWVTFIDSDDWVNEYFLDKFLNEYGNADFDVFIGGSYAISSSGTKTIEKEYKEEHCTLHNAVKFKQIHRFADLHGKVFKLNLIKRNRLTFLSTISYAEDGLFFDKFLLHVNKIFVTDKECYYYEKHEGGLSTRVNSFQSESICFALYIETLRELSIKANCEITPNPGIAYRVILSGYRDLDKKEFANNLSHMPATNLEALADGCRLLRAGSILSYLLKNKRYRMLYNSLFFAFPRLSVTKL